MPYPPAVGPHQIHRSAFGGAIAVDRLATAIQTRARSFAGVLRTYAAETAWAHSHDDGSGLPQLVSAVASDLRVTVDLHTVLVETELLSNVVKWRLFPRSLRVHPRSGRHVWTRGEPIVELDGRIGTEPPEDLARRGGWLAEKWIARQIQGRTIVAEREIRVEPRPPTPLPAPAVVQDQRIEKPVRTRGPPDVPPAGLASVPDPQHARSLSFDRSAFGAHIHADRLAEFIRRNASTFVGIVRPYTTGAAWAFSDHNGRDLATLVAAAATHFRTTIQVRTVHIEMVPLRQTVSWRLFPHSANVGPRARQITWARAEVLSTRDACEASDTLDDLALRGGWFAGLWIEREIEGAAIRPEHEVRVENAPAGPELEPKPYTRRSRRLEDLLRRAGSARSVIWNAEPDGCWTIELWLADGSIARGLLTPADAAALRDALSTTPSGVNGPTDGRTPRRAKP